MNEPDMVVGAIAVTIQTAGGRMTLSTDLKADIQVNGDTIDDLGLGINPDSLRKEVVGHLRALAKVINNPNSDLAALFEMEMK